MDDVEFRKECLDRGRLRPLPSATERLRYADDARRLSARKLEAARVLLAHGPEEMAIGEAYFAMEHKTNELLALAGYRSKSHLCTCVALGRLLERRDLAQSLSRGYQDRQTFDYTSDPGAMLLAEDPAGFVAAAEAFVAAVEALAAARRAKLA